MPDADEAEAAVRLPGVLPVGAGGVGGVRADAGDLRLGESDPESGVPAQ